MAAATTSDGYTWIEKEITRKGKTFKMWFRTKAKGVPTNTAQKLVASAPATKPPTVLQATGNKPLVVDMMHLVHKAKIEPKHVKTLERVDHELKQFPDNKRINLVEVREKLTQAGLSKKEQDTLLIQIQRAGKLVLYRNDVTRSLTKEDHDNALQVGDSPRHLVYFTRT